jgi:hypothetical protein
VAKVGRHPGELYPRVGFIVTNLPGRPNGSSKPAPGVPSSRCATIVSPTRPVSST